MKKRTLVIISCILLLAVGAMYFAQSKPLTVESSVVSRGEITRLVSETGFVTPAEERTVYAESSYTVSQVTVKKGDRVSAGSAVVLGQTQDLAYRLSIVEANLSAARARYFSASRLEIPLAVKKAEAEVDAARIDHARALEHLTDLRKTIGDTSWSLTTYDRVIEDIPALRKVYQLGKVKEEDWKAAVDRYEIASARLQSAEAALREAMGRASPESLRSHVAEIEALSFEADILKYDLARRTARAPIDGVVVSTEVKPGSVVSPGTPLVTVYSHELVVKCEILSQDMPLIKAGQEVAISGKSLGGLVLGGRVSSLGPRAVESVSELGLKQRRVAVEIEFTEPVAQNILPGYPVDVDIVVSRSQGLKVPAKAVFQIGRQHHVFVIKGGRASLQPVKLGIESDDYVEVVSGLTEGDVVIIAPPRDLKPGQKVSSKK